MAAARVLIIGHNGFIGERVSQRLSELHPDLVVDGLSAPETDMTLPEGAARVAEAMTPETTVLMLAGIKRQLGDSAEIFGKNTAIMTAFGRLIDANPVKRIVYLSSGAVYGEDVENLAFKEDSPLTARSWYGLSKIAFEFMLERFAEAHPGTEVSVLRPATIYGPGDVPNAYGPSGFLTAALGDGKVTLWGEGDELRELLYIDDIVDLIARLTVSGQRGPLNLVAGRSYTFRDAVSAVEAVTGRTLEVSTRPRSKPKVDNAYDNSALRTVFPDFAFTTLDEGVRRMLAARTRG